MAQDKRMKAGDIVIPHDNSYNVCASTGKWTDIYHKRCEVIAFGSGFPSDGSMRGLNACDSIIRVIDSGKIVFTMKRFLRPENTSLEDAINAFGCHADKVRNLVKALKED